MGDFNLVPDPGLDRLSGVAGPVSDLSSWAEASNLTDVWRWRYPDQRAYTCHSASHKSFSRIDLAYVGGSVLPRVRGVSILPRGVSDHAPLQLRLGVSAVPGEGLWRLSRFWLSDSRVSEPYRSEVIQYWRDLDPTVPLTVSWDAFKAFSRGSLQTHIRRTRRDMREDIRRAEMRVTTLETEYTATRDPGVYSDFQTALRDVLLLRTSATKTKLLHQSQRIFEHGEKTGSMLAWLTRESSSPVTISAIADSDGSLLTDPTAINGRFASFYRELYSSRLTCTDEELTSYLEETELPCLTSAYRDALDAPITLDEIRRAVSSLQGGKTPGPDGIPAELFKTYMEELLPAFKLMLQKAEERECLPQTMAEAVIVVILKPGKAPDQCSSYRPISLLNVDAKILAKILAGRLNVVITALVHADQSGFMPGRGTDINIRRLLTHLARADGGGPEVVASLDAEKAFDSVEWRYLWAVLRKFGFGPRFVRWVQLLYRDPMARIRTNNSLSSPFPLSRGTRQGCPLSPGLFALAMEPMAARIRAAPRVEGIPVGVVTDKISLYADDTLLFLRDVSSLPPALHIVDVFGSLSGIKVNWGKSLLFSLHPSGPRPPTGTPLNWTSEFKYLGILIRAPLSSYIDLNLMPLLKTFSRRCAAWRSLPLSPVGRVNLVKMVYLPKFLYFFRNSPSIPPASFFATLNGIISSFVWNGRPPRLAISTLQLPIARGGLSLPDFQVYFWAAVLVTVRWWFSQPKDNPAVTLEAAIMGSYSSLSNLVFRGPKSHPGLTEPMRTTISVWHRVSVRNNSPGTYSPHLPLWGNPTLPHLNTVPDPQVWAKRGIVNLKHIVAGGKLRAFPDLREAYHLPGWMLFRYYQLRHAYNKQFPPYIDLGSDSVERLLTAKVIDRPLSSLYLCLSVGPTGKLEKAMSKWRGDIPDLTEEEWEATLSSFVTNMISAKDRFLQVKFLHRAYFTPKRLTLMNPETPVNCPRCDLQAASFLHMIWTCPRLVDYWTGVVDSLNGITSLDMGPDSRALLLNIFGAAVRGKYTRLFLGYATFYARKVIFLHWKDAAPPTVSMWRTVVNSAIPLYKLTYLNRNCPNKFNKIWSGWIDAWGEGPLGDARDGVAGDAPQP